MPTTTDEDIRFMRAALEEARAALAIDEIPIGAVIVSGGRIIGRGHNMTETLSDVTAHAEMLAITAATQTIGGKYLTDATLYVTVEPCLMCTGAIAWAQIPRIVYGATDPKRGYTSYIQPITPQLRNATPSQRHNSPFHPRSTVTSGIFADECATLMKEFFQSKRRQ